MSTRSVRSMIGLFRRGDLDDDAPAGKLFRYWLYVFLGMFGFVFCLTCLFMGMRGVMELGGFVASGGPYAIAHPAPDWVWLVPVSIVTGLIFAFFYGAGAGKIGGISIIITGWSALFLSLGYNFMEYGLNPPKGMDKPAWGWVICWIVFWLMGGFPVLIWIGALFKRLFRGRTGGESAAGSGLTARGVAVTITHLVAIGMGIYLGLMFFKNLAA